MTRFAPQNTHEHDFAKVNQLADDYLNLHKADTQLQNLVNAQDLERQEGIERTKNR